jgi:hypothetical protein
MLNHYNIKPYKSNLTYITCKFSVILRSDTLKHFILYIIVICLRPLVILILRFLLYIALIKMMYIS